MRIDPLDVFGHTIASMPLRLALAWLVGTLGAFAPLVLAHGFDIPDAFTLQLLFFPFYIFLLPFFSGWWGVPAFLLLIAFGWRVLVFLRGDSQTVELGWLFFLPYLIGIRASGDHWPMAVLVALPVLVLLARYYWLRRI